VLADGKIYTGCNVENASYGLTMCAERVAIFKAVADGAKRISRLAVACLDVPRSANAKFRMPCGACRQVMTEFADKNFIVAVEGVGEFSMDELLPGPFTL